ncbi:MAG: hypothetical protein VR64_10850 [Desulfatitalea sp. BRH_c12]|nr:MAG: hypothetical protein VR64_10850 [Desulfatitalea sp. BRH_c12]
MVQPSLRPFVKMRVRPCTTTPARGPNTAIQPRTSRGRILVAAGHVHASNPGQAAVLPRVAFGANDHLIAGGDHVGGRKHIAGLDEIELTRVGSL